jgi:hypothetical protein
MFSVTGYEFDLESVRHAVTVARSYRETLLGLGIPSTKLRSRYFVALREYVTNYSLDTTHFTRSRPTKTTAEIRERVRRYQRNLGRQRRLDPRLVPNHVVKDSRSTDKKLCRENDLTLEFVKDLLGRGCQYCGETDMRMTLDRIDNSLGHTQQNVVPACIRCNLVRRDMPYEAWSLVATAMREARKNQLFGGWMKK